MGRAKEWLMEQHERGYSSVGDKFVCGECVSDYALVDQINKSASSNECSYCGRVSKKAIATHFDNFAKYILRGLRNEYGDPNDEGVGWEQGWVGNVIDTYDALFDEICLDIENEKLRDDIIYSLGDHQWCQKNFYELTPSQTLQYGWERFVNVIKHHARYVFFRLNEGSEDADSSDFIPPSSFLDEFGKVIEKLALVRKLPANTEILRMRVHSEGLTYLSAADLGSPPNGACIYPNRMSPAGISMFYGAFDSETCVAETYDPNGNKHDGTIAIFSNLRELTLLDLTKVPGVPSVFEPNTYNVRHSIKFVHSFLRDFSSPIEKDGREHIEYVPTQVVSEYVRHVLKFGETKCDGILYSSSRKHGHHACVLFFDHTACADKGKVTEKTALVLLKMEKINLRK